MINKVILIGNLGKDPEIRHLEAGTAVGSFSIATNENYLDKDQQWQTITEWHNIVVWRNLAERAERQLKKGMQVYIEGKLRTRKWQDSEGKDRYTTEVIANMFRTLGKREESGSDFPGIEDVPPSQSTNDSQDTSNKSTETDLPF